MICSPVPHGLAPAVKAGRLHDCWRYDPADDDAVDLEEPTDVDPPWLVAADALVAAGRAADTEAA
jgi:hypothetical protein